MNIELQDQCKEIIIKCRSYKKKAYEVKKRNDLFLIMKPFMLKWIKSILKGWSRYEEEDKILSLSWDCFEYCFYKYSNYNVHIPKFFYDFTKYFLLMHYGAKDKVSLPINELKKTLQLVSSEDNICLDKLLTLMQFRNVIPDEDKVVWDDAVQSLSSKISDRRKTYKHGMDDNFYRRLKKSYIPIIKLILGS
jgi:hypothetical protein